VRLEASPKTLVARIREREAASRPGLPALVEHARRLASAMPGLSGVDLALRTEGQRPEATAERIRAALPALAPRDDRRTVGA